MARTKKILVVDDEAGIRNLLFDVLSSEGFNVSLAKDGQDSLDQMENRRFDLLITDINMPCVDGIELLKRMKKAGRKERVIIMTGKSVSHRLLEEDMPPVFTQLNKPFPMNSLLEVVISSLSRPDESRREDASSG
jgi:two-component system response regulator (stage 0 sporulation protein F)